MPNTPSTLQQAIMDSTIPPSGTVIDFTIQFGTQTSGAVGTRNPWILGLPLVEVDGSFLDYGNTGIAVVEVYALP